MNAHSLARSVCFPVMVVSDFTLSPQDPGDPGAALSQQRTPFKHARARTHSAATTQPAAPLRAEDLIVDAYEVHFGQKVPAPTLPPPY